MSVEMTDQISASDRAAAFLAEVEAKQNPTPFIPVAPGWVIRTRRYEPDGFEYVGLPQFFDMVGWVWKDHTWAPAYYDDFLSPIAPDPEKVNVAVRRMPHADDTHVDLYKDDVF